MLQYDLGTCVCCVCCAVCVLCVTDTTTTLRASHDCISLLNGIHLRCNLQITNRISQCYDMSVLFTLIQKSRYFARSVVLQTVSVDTLQPKTKETTGCLTSCITRSCITCISHQILRWRLWDGHDMWHACRRREMRTEFQYGNLKEIDHLEGAVVYRGITLKRI